MTDLNIYSKEQTDNLLNAKANASALAGKQDTLVSGTNIKTINGETLLGSGNITTPKPPSIDSMNSVANMYLYLQSHRLQWGDIILFDLPLSSSNIHWRGYMVVTEMLDTGDIAGIGVGVYSTSSIDANAFYAIRFYEDGGVAGTYTIINGGTSAYGQINKYTPSNIHITVIRQG